MTKERQCRRCGASYDVRSKGCDRCGLPKPVTSNEGVNDVIAAIVTPPNFNLDEASARGLPPGAYDIMLNDAGRFVVIGETGRKKH